jgi:hypothetical protein
MAPAVAKARVPAILHARMATVRPIAEQGPVAASVALLRVSVLQVVSWILAWQEMLECVQKAI